jgi:hypothetical protein
MARINPPTERTCERCGRMEVWSETEQTFVAGTVDGQKRRGEPHCLHEWDINGEYNPLQDTEA